MGCGDPHCRGTYPTYCYRTVKWNCQGVHLENQGEASTKPLWYENVPPRVHTPVRTYLKELGPCITESSSARGLCSRLARIHTKQK